LPRRAVMRITIRAASAASRMDCPTRARILRPFRTMVVVDMDGSS
jgi:hypothetical protein